MLEQAASRLACKARPITILIIGIFLSGQCAYAQDFGQSRSGYLLNRLKQQTQQAQQQEQARKQQEEAMKKWQTDLANAMCLGQSPPPKPQITNPDQKGKNNSWKNFTNSLGRTNSTSGHMDGYQGNQAYRGVREGDTWTQKDTWTNHFDPNAQKYFPPTEPAPTLSGQQINQLMQNARTH